MIRKDYKPPSPLVWAREYANPKTINPHLYVEDDWTLKKRLRKNTLLSLLNLKLKLLFVIVNAKSRYLRFAQPRY